MKISASSIPRVSLPKLRILLVIGASALILSGCSTFGRKQKEKLAYVERPAETLYNNAMTRMDNRNWDEAVLFFR